ncbi:LLM class flavin-dependent oxidoreductase [Actinocorallia longicatena]|uniref:LLM class flavin-dependent oxidoreductase n=1 Tax=Actinocorallia longicatena TaxID=111803 RepID=A0ABP6Q7B6_9ACTN
MNVGVVMWPIEEWPAMGERWRQAEEFGFHSAWIYDHTAWRGHTPWDDAYATLPAAAALTSTIRLGTLVTTPNFRHPVPTASAIKTIDRISGGRLTLGIGAGGSAHTSDGDILGEEWTPRERADRFAEWTGQLDALLTRSPVTVEGDHWTAREVTLAPGLVQRRPPFLIAGEGPRGMRLAARLGQGWIANPDVPDGPALPVVRTQLAKLEAACEAEGRDFADLSKLMLTGFSGDGWLASRAAFEDLHGRYAEIGITDLVIHWPRPGSAWDADFAVFEQIAEFVQSR